MAKNIAQRIAKATEHATAAKDAAAYIANALADPSVYNEAQMFAAAKILESAGCYVRRNVCQ